VWRHVTECGQCRRNFLKAAPEGRSLMFCSSGPRFNVRLQQGVSGGPDRDCNPGCDTWLGPTYGRGRLGRVRHPNSLENIAGHHDEVPPSVRRRNPDGSSTRRAIYSGCRPGTSSRPPKHSRRPDFVAEPELRVKAEERRFSNADRLLVKRSKMARQVELKQDCPILLRAPDDHKRH
jgi:hypothetical protein